MGCLEPPPPQHYSDQRRVAAIPEKKSPENASRPSANAASLT